MYTSFAENLCAPTRVFDRLQVSAHTGLPAVTTETCASLRHVTCAFAHDTVMCALRTTVIAELANKISSRFGHFHNHRFSKPCAPLLV